MWPEFMHHDPVVNRLWPGLATKFAGFQVAVCERGEVLAAGNAIPFVWDGKAENLPGGLDAVLEAGFADLSRGHEPTAVSALSATISPEHRGRGLSGKVLEAMREAAAWKGIRAFVAPVRPTAKHRYPLTPMKRYVHWRREDESFFDPWLRVHERLGATYARVAPESMTITGTVSEWEGWTGMRFPESGPYIVPGALEPVEMNAEEDRGVYAEPNVWMVYGSGG